jgi:DNA replication and repair protein RecF
VYLQWAGKKSSAGTYITYNRLTDHVGLIPVVMITPDDSTIIDEGSDLRRRFIDNTLSQIDHNYLEDLVNYNRILQQRNAGPEAICR